MARTWLWTAWAGFDQSIRPSSLRSLGALVTRVFSWGRICAVPASSAAMASAISGAPSAAGGPRGRRRSRRGRSVCGPRRSFPPASIRGVIRITVTPDLALAMLDRAGHGSRAPVGGQDRAVEVDPSEPGNAEQVGRKDLAVGRRHQQVGPERAEASSDSGALTSSG